MTQGTTTALPPASKFDLRDRVAIVTGAGRNIGRAIALALADAGAHVCVVARTRADIEETARQVEARGRRALAIPADVCNSAEVDALAADVKAQFGRIDILVNHVGGASPNLPFEKDRAVPAPATRPGRPSAAGGAPIFSVSDEDWEKAFRQNMTSMFYCCRAVGRVMAEQKRGVIINTSSATSMIASSAAPYPCSKAAVNQFTRGLAAELGPLGIRVNGILLGLIENALWKVPEASRQDWLSDTPLGRIGEIEEIPPAVVFLASDASSYITGNLLRISGGVAVYG